VRYKVPSALKGGEMREKAREMVNRYGGVFKQCFESAFNNWIERHRDELSIHRGRTRSSFVWDCVVEQLRSSLALDGKFRFIDTRGTTYIVYDQCLLMKVKKLDRGLKTSNLPTFTSERFNHQMDLGFGQDWTHVYLGYVPDDLNTRIEQIHLTCPNGNKLAWSIPIIGDPYNQQPLNFLTEDHIVPIPRKRIRPKTSRERSVESDGG
jgi:hypothetical protein